MNANNLNSPKTLEAKYVAITFKQTKIRSSCGPKTHEIISEVLPIHMPYAPFKHT